MSEFSLTSDSINGLWRQVAPVVASYLPGVQGLDAFLPRDLDERVGHAIVAHRSQPLVNRLALHLKAGFGCVDWECS